MTQAYDSKSEATQSEALLAAGFIRCNSFGITKILFSDKSGAQFMAKPDFYSEDLDLFIDLKSHSLNTKTCIASSSKRLSGQLTHFMGIPAIDADAINHNEASGMLWRANKRKCVLEAAWNHSLYKHAIVQTVLTPKRYMVVFTTAPSEADAKLYKKKGLVYSTIEQLLASGLH